MNNEQPSILNPCPEDYRGHYIASAQDSLTFLAGLFSITEKDLLKANPHITSLDTLAAGTRIHIPGLIPFPAGVNLTLMDKEMPFASGGGVFIHLSPEGGQSVSVIATLPTPSYFGSYDLYLVEVLASPSNIFEGQLFATPDDPPSWAARIDLPFLTSLTAESLVLIRPFNSENGNSAGPILQAQLSEIPPMDCGSSETLSITSEFDNENDPAALPMEENPIPESDDDLEDTEVFDDISVLDLNPEGHEPEAEPDPEETEDPAPNTTEDPAPDTTEAPPPEKNSAARISIIYDANYKAADASRQPAEGGLDNGETDNGGNGPDIAADAALPDTEAVINEQADLTADFLTDEILLSPAEDEAGQEGIAAAEDEAEQGEIDAAEDVSGPADDTDPESGEITSTEDEPDPEAEIVNDEILLSSEENAPEPLELIAADDVPGSIEDPSPENEEEAMPSADEPDAATDIPPDEEASAPEGAESEPEEIFDGDALDVEGEPSWENSAADTEEPLIHALETAILPTGQEQSDENSAETGDLPSEEREDAISGEEPVFAPDISAEAVAAEEATASAAEPEYEESTEPHAINADKKPVLKLGYNNRPQTLKYSPFISGIKTRIPINLVLKGTPEALQAIGAASIQLLPSQINVTALRLPEPENLGEDYKYYKTWLVDLGKNQIAAVVMKKILNGVWAGQLSGAALKAIDQVFITAEATPNVEEPTGPKVLIGVSA